MKNHNISFGARAGFSLLELLAAMAILMTIVSMMTMIFSDSDRAWNFGADTSENNNAGRAALGMIAQDLQYAIADELITFNKRPQREPGFLPPYQFDNIGLGRCDEISFVSIQHDSGETDPETPTRSAREIMYWVNTNEFMESTGEIIKRYELIRGVYGAEISDENTYDMHCYVNRDWFEDDVYGGVGRPTNCAVIAQNVAGLAFKTPWDAPLAGSGYEYDSRDWSNALPPYVDVYLEVLDRRVAIEVARMEWMGLPPDDISDKVEKNLKRYATRVFFHNRSGYWLKHQNPEDFPFALMPAL